jgi:hypothetical protein
MAEENPRIVTAEARPAKSKKRRASRHRKNVRSANASGRRFSPLGFARLNLPILLAALFDPKSQRTKLTRSESAF